MITAVLFHSTHHLDRVGELKHFSYWCTLVDKTCSLLLHVDIHRTILGELMTEVSSSCDVGEITSVELDRSRVITTHYRYYRLLGLGGFTHDDWKSCQLWIHITLTFLDLHINLFWQNDSWQSYLSLRSWIFILAWPIETLEAIKLLEFSKFNCRSRSDSTNLILLLNDRPDCP